MANRDPEPESDREEYSPEYLKKRRAGEPLAAAPPEPTEEYKETSPLTVHGESGSKVDEASEAKVEAPSEAEVAAAKVEADRRSALTQEERDAEDRAKGV